MRKWMRDRLMRRKKTAASKAESGEPQPAPLQPAYFEPSAGGEEPPPRQSDDSQSFQAEEPADEPAGEPAAASTEGHGPASNRPKRRRRGRGGRGRKRSGSTASPPVETGPIVPVLTPAEGEAKPAAPAPFTRPPQAPKGTVVLAIGLPGSGKSSWFKRHNIAPLSTDLLRSLLFDDADEQRYQDLVFSNLRNMLRARLIARRPLSYVDATNLTPHERQGWIKMAKDYNYEVQAVYFDVPLEVCLERNHKRQRTVADDVMRRMAGKLKAPSFDEGFSKITVVRVKKTA